MTEEPSPPSTAERSEAPPSDGAPAPAPSPAPQQTPPAEAVHPVEDELHARRRSAAASPAAWTLFLGVAVLGLVTDLASKALAFRFVAGQPVAVSRGEVLAAAPDLHRLIPPHDPVVVLPKVLHFTLVLNPGAVFGIGAGRRWFFVAFTMLAVVFATWMFSRWTHAKDRLAHVGLGLLVSGGLGNLYDRLVFASVRDFIHPLPEMRLPFGLAWPGGSRELWPYVSNVADAYLLVGIALLLIYSWRRPAA